VLINIWLNAFFVTLSSLRFAFFIGFQSFSQHPTLKKAPELEKCSTHSDFAECSLHKLMLFVHSHSWAIALLVSFFHFRGFFADANEKTPLSLKSIKWMHIQKTSSWIGDFLLLYACPHLRPAYDQMNDQVFFYDQVRTHPEMLTECEVQVTRGYDGAFGWHDPYLPTHVGNGTTISIFRKPEYRLISSFLFNMMIPSGNVYSDNNTLPEYVYKAAQPLIAYADVPGMASCQIKMVLGHYCGKWYRNCPEQTLKKQNTE